MFSKIVIFVFFTTLIWNEAQSISLRTKENSAKSSNTKCANVSECAPYFLQDMSSFVNSRLPAGTDQKFLCAADGKPKPNITWYKDGADLKIDQQDWTMHNLKEKDAGEYTCTLCNVLGCISHTFKTEIIRNEDDKTLKIIKGPKDATVKVGSSHVFVCTHTRPSDDTNYYIEWYVWTGNAALDGEPKTNDMSNEDTRAKNSPIYEIPYVTLEDEGRYECVVYDRYRRISQSAYMKVIPNENECTCSNNLPSFATSVALTVCLIAILSIVLYQSYSLRKKSRYDTIQKVLLTNS